MADWNPYQSALIELREMGSGGMEEYIVTRLAGGASEPLHNWSRNEEAPEDFIIWAHGANDAQLAGELESATARLVRSHLEGLGGNHPYEGQVLSRLLYLGTAIKSVAVGKVLGDFLTIPPWQLNLDLARELVAVKQIPWAETLLHQALATLSVLEKEMPREERRASRELWRPIVRRCPAPYDDAQRFPLSLQIVALRALARFNWLSIQSGWERPLNQTDTDLTDLGCYVTGALHEELARGRSQRRVARDLADVLNFFIQESISQSTQEPTRYPKGDLLDDPTPIARAFHRLADNAQAMNLLQLALDLIAKASRAFGDDRNRQRAWQEDQPRVMLAVYEVDPDVNRQRKVAELRRKAAARPVSVDSTMSLLGGLRGIAQQARA